MLLFFGLLLIIVFGLLLSIVLVPEMHILERLGSAFFLGFGIFSLIMFCYSTVGIRINLQSSLIALLLLNGLLLLSCKLLKRSINLSLLSFWKSIIKLPYFEKAIVLVIGTFGIGSLVLSNYFPVYIWDALALYDFRAKIIAEQGFYTQIAGNFFWFAGYPLFTSLSHTFVYLFGGNNPQFLYSLMYISFASVFYGAVRQLISRRAAMLATLILVTTPLFFEHSTFAYTNLPYSIFLSMGTIYLFVWFAKNKGVGYLILSAFMTGLSTWTRSTEPFWIVNIAFLVILSIYRYKKYLVNTIWYVLAFLMIREPWDIVNYYLLSSPTEQSVPLVVAEAKSYWYSISQTVFNWQRIVDVSVFIYKNVIVSWYPLLFLFLFCFLGNIKNHFKNISTVFLIIILTYFCFLVYATYVFSLYQNSWQTIPDSARRMAMFFLPLMVFYIGLVFGSTDPDIKLRKTQTKRHGK